MRDFLTETYLSDGVILFRFFVSFSLGSCIGWERASRRQFAGLRTHILICMGSTALMLLSIWIPSVLMQGRIGDPTRIAAQVVSGIGFLGGGAILRIGANVRGLTTAASIWVASGLGLLIGAGMYIPAVCLTVFTLITLTVMGNLEHMVFPTRQNKTLEITFFGVAPNLQKIIDVLMPYKIVVLSTELQKCRGKNEESKYLLLLSVPDNINLKKIGKELEGIHSIEKIEIK